MRPIFGQNVSVLGPKYHFQCKNIIFWAKKGVLGTRIMGICGIFFSSSNSREFPCACLHKPNQKCPCGKKTKWPTPFTPFFLVEVTLCLNLCSLLVFVISFGDFSDFNFISKVSFYCPTTSHSSQATSAKGGGKNIK